LVTPLSAAWPFLMRHGRQFRQHPRVNLRCSPRAHGAVRIRPLRRNGHHGHTFRHRSDVAAMAIDPILPTAPA
jgi:hypothetical protein